MTITIFYILEKLRNKRRSPEESSTLTLGSCLTSGAVWFIFVTKRTITNASENEQLRN